MWMSNPFPTSTPEHAGGPREPFPGRDRTADDRNDVAVMRRELDELKQAIRDGLATTTAKPRKKKT